MDYIPSESAIQRTVEATGLEPMQAYHHLRAIHAVQHEIGRQSQRRLRLREQHEWMVQ
jgi:hypothetical protein